MFRQQVVRYKRKRAYEFEEDLLEEDGDVNEEASLISFCCCSR
jgi:hypothetical protein